MRMLASWPGLVIGGLLLVLGLGNLYLGLAAGEVFAAEVRWGRVLNGLFVALAGAALFWFAWNARRQLGPRSVLVINFERPVIESQPDDRAGRLMLSGRARVGDVVDALDRAAADPRIVGVIGRIGDGALGMGVIDEFRQAITRFRASGKPALAHAETLGEFAPGNAGYYLACAFDEIHLQPSGDLGLTGLRSENLFVAGVLDKLEVTPRLDRRREYKSFMDTFTETGFTRAHREATESIIEGLFDGMVEAIAEARGLEPDRVRALADSGPLLGPEALESGLVDGLGYRDEVHARMSKLAGGEFKPVTDSAYLALAGRPNRRGVPVALIHGTGMVQRGGGRFSPLTGGSSMGADTVCRAIREAVDNPKVRAILLRIDSPGGSYVASDTIRREILRAREAGKPVVASLGNVAASGGYFVAMAADRVVAQPGTLTGSIGVLGGKLLTRRAWKRLGITWDAVQTSENAAMFSSLEDFTRHGRKRHQAWLDRIYEDFVGKAAEDRGMTAEEMEARARGRVWTGRQALERGLVDALGGQAEAAGALRELLKLPADAPLRMLPYPVPKPAWLAVLQREEPTVAALARGLIAELQSVLEPLHRAGLLRPPAVLEMRDRQRIE